MRTWKRINCVKKGYRAEKECLDILKEQGYVYFWKTIRNRFLDLDFFGLFDVVVRGKTGKILYVQVKSGKVEPSLESALTKKNKEGLCIYDFVLSLNPNEDVEVWIRRNAGWKGRGNEKKFHGAEWYRWCWNKHRLGWTKVPLVVGDEQGVLSV